MSIVLLLQDRLLTDSQQRIGDELTIANKVAHSRAGDLSVVSMGVGDAAEITSATHCLANGNLQFTLHEPTRFWAVLYDHGQDRQEVRMFSADAGRVISEICLSVPECGLCIGPYQWYHAFHALGHSPEDAMKLVAKLHPSCGLPIRSFKLPIPLLGREAAVDDGITSLVS